MKFYSHAHKAVAAVICYAFSDIEIFYTCRSSWSNRNRTKLGENRLPVGLQLQGTQPLLFGGLK